MYQKIIPIDKDSFIEITTVLSESKIVPLLRVRGKGADGRGISMSVILEGDSASEVVKGLEEAQSFELPEELK